MERTKMTRFGTGYVSLSRFENYDEILLHPFYLNEFKAINENNSKKYFRDYLIKIKEKEKIFLESCQNKK